MEDKQSSIEGQATKPVEVLAESSGNAALSGNAQHAEKPQSKKSNWGGESTEAAKDSDADEKPNGGTEQIQVTEGVAKKKKKRKPKSQRNKGVSKPTGFEEYYVDPPVTPDEFQEELALYDPSKPFNERIQIAIQRYTARRKFDSTRKDLFDKYMTFGGVHSGPNMFGGGDVHDDDLDAGDIAQMKATHYVSEDVNKNYVVDFDGMLKAFLSSRMPVVFDLSTEGAIKTYVQVLRNFLNYLLHHDVCPEYRDQVEAARRTCDTGQAQLWLIQQSVIALPGDFNKACSTIFGGYYEATPIADKIWAEKMGLSKGFEHDQASHILQGGLAAHGDETMCNLYNRQVASKTARRVNSFKVLMEVTALDFASSEVEELYEHPSMAGCLPLGKLRAQTWHCPGDTLDDLTEEEEEQRARNEAPAEKFEFWVENAVLDKMFVGMKLEVQVHELSFGVRYFDTISAALCSFYSEVPNELMMGWREHKYLEPREAMEPDNVGVYMPDNVGVYMPDYRPGDGGGEMEVGVEGLEKYEQGEDIVVNG